MVACITCVCVCMDYNTLLQVKTNTFYFISTFYSHRQYVYSRTFRIRVWVHHGTGECILSDKNRCFIMSACVTADISSVRVQVAGYMHGTVPYILCLPSNVESICYEHQIFQSYGQFSHPRPGVPYVQYNTLQVSKFIGTDRDKKLEGLFSQLIAAPMIYVQCTRSNKNKNIFHCKIYQYL